MTEKKWEQGIALFLVLAGVLVRVLPHPPNFTPLTALAIFSGAILSPGVALTVPLAAMIASDLLIGPHPLFWLTWGSFFLVTFLGQWVRRDYSALRIFSGTVAGSLLFFSLTNLGVFLFQNMYPKSFAGLVECYVMALPFLRNALAGDIFYAAVFFGIFHISKNYSSRFLAQKG